MNSLVFRGGVWKPSEHTVEKFLLFFLIGNQEVMLYQMLQDGLAVRAEGGKDEILTKFRICKVFAAKQGFGIPRQHHSFYLELDDTMPMIQIFPFSEDTEREYSFRAKAKMLGKEDVLKLLPEELESRHFFLRQEVLPINLASRMVVVDRSESKVGIRYVKIGGRKESE